MKTERLGVRVFAGCLMVSGSIGTCVCVFRLSVCLMYFQVSHICDAFIAFFVKEEKHTSPGVHDGEPIAF